MENIISLTDSYKFSHFNQYPAGAEQVYSYMEARGGEYEDIVMFGLQYYLREYLKNPIFLLDETLPWSHGVPFFKEGWRHLNNNHTQPIGLPLEIKAVPEGSINKPGDVLMTITNTDPNFPWLVGWMETLLMKIWYPVTVASKSYAVKKVLQHHYTITSDNPDKVQFAYHNFGDRGATSVEAAALGGMAHLTQFMGTDNFNSLNYARAYYSEPCAGFSIPATEHSTVTSWGRDGEFLFYENYLETYKSSPMIACVMDSYDIFKAVDFVTSGTMKERIESADYPLFVIRPDSGDPCEVIDRILEIMESNDVAYTANSKGYKVFNKYRIIWGDGITPYMIQKILDVGRWSRYAADNFAFGSGGDLMQNITRDTCRFAIKCSAINVNGEWRDVYKDPITDKGKASKRGLVTNPKLQTVFRNGTLYNLSTFKEIRERSNV